MGRPCAPHRGKKPLNKFGALDKEAVREMFLSSPHFAWAEFARSQNWESRASSVNFPVARWQREWIERKIQEQDKVNLPRALALRDRLITSRLKSYDDNLDIIHALKSLLKHATSKQLEAVKVGTIPMVDKDTLVAYAAAQKTLQMCEIENAKFRDDLPDLVETTRENLSIQGEQDVDHAHNTIEVIGTGTIPEREACALLTRFMDKIPAAPPPPGPKPDIDLERIEPDAERIVPEEGGGA